MPDANAKLHQHPMDSGQTVYGLQLMAGDVIQQEDVYDSTSGRWTPAPCPGATLQEGFAATWIRPVSETEQTT